MITEVATEIAKRAAALLLLSKPENRTSHLLSVFGLFPTDFNASDPLRVSYDGDGVTVRALAFKGICTCADNPKDPVLYTIPGDSVRHSRQCDAYKAYKIGTNPHLVEVEHVDEDGRAYMVFSFQWPRQLGDSEKNVITSVFGELQSDPMWANFQKSWGVIANMMPDRLQSYQEKIEALRAADGGAPSPEAAVDASLTQVSEDKPQPASGPVTTPVVSGFDFGDMDMDAPASTPDPKPIEEVAKEVTGKRRKQKEAKPEEPAESKAETPAPKVAEGTTEKVISGGTELAITVSEDARDPKAPETKPEKTEKPEKESKPRKEKERKPNPAIAKFVQVAEEEMASLRTSLQGLLEMDGFPVDTLKMLKSRFDRLAVKTAHLVYRGGHETERAGAINPLIEVTLANVNGQVSAALRDLSLSPEKPNAWIDFKKELKEAGERADSMADIMAQMGVADAIQEPPKLRDSEGRALV